MRDSGWTDTTATSITSGKHHGLADARSRPPAAPTHRVTEITTFTTSVYNDGRHVNLERELRQNIPEHCFEAAEEAAHIPSVAKQIQRCYVIQILYEK